MSVGGKGIHYLSSHAVEHGSHLLVHGRSHHAGSHCSEIVECLFGIVAEQFNPFAVIHIGPYGIEAGQVFGACRFGQVMCHIPFDFFHAHHFVVAHSHGPATVEAEGSLCVGIADGDDTDDD